MFREYHIIFHFPFKRWNQFFGWFLMILKIKKFLSKKEIQNSQCHQIMIHLVLIFIENLKKNLKYNIIIAHNVYWTIY